MRITPVPCLSDNYAYLVECPKTHAAAIVDPSEGAPVLAAIEKHALRPRAIWCTHHHPDHVGGNEAVMSKLGITEVLGHASDKGRIPGQSRFMNTGDTFELGSLRIRTIHIPGHTLGAIAYVVTADGEPPALFTGDTLFIAGCGRLFEGTPAQMHTSLQALAAVGDAGRVFCGHEYTESNLRFAAHVEPNNARLREAQARAKQVRAEGRPTMGSTMGEELATNPFLRVRSAEIRKTLDIPAGAPDEEALGAIRKAKDNFK
jgi:hydroxyacylglutathione hydrolase